MIFTVAIDGPAAAGKGTIARAVAAHFGFAYLDTGLLYRAAARKVIDGMVLTQVNGKVAEGVEDAQALQLLREMGAGHAQGYHFARPLPLEVLVEHPLMASLVTVHSAD